MKVQHAGHPGERVGMMGRASAITSSPVMRRDFVEFVPFMAVAGLFCHHGQPLRSNRASANRDGSPAATTVPVMSKDSGSPCQSVKWPPAPSITAAQA